VEEVTAAASARRGQSVTELLLSIVLALEAVLVFFVALVVYGLDALPPAQAFGGGAALIVVLLLTSRLLRYRWAIAIGWLVQLVLIATGVLVPLMYFVAAVFLALWIFCFVRGRSIDSQKAAFAASASTPPVSNQGETA
jgi:hypothetical protein